MKDVIKSMVKDHPFISYLAATSIVGSVTKMVSDSIRYITGYKEVTPVRTGEVANAVADCCDNIVKAIEGRKAETEGTEEPVVDDDLQDDISEEAESVTEEEEG